MSPQKKSEKGSRKRVLQQAFFSFLHGRLSWLFHHSIDEPIIEIESNRMKTQDGQGGLCALRLLIHAQAQAQAQDQDLLSILSQIARGNKLLAQGIQVFVLDCLLCLLAPLILESPIVWSCVIYHCFPPPIRFPPSLFFSFHFFSFHSIPFHELALALACE